MKICILSCAHVVKIFDFNSFGYKPVIPGRRIVESHNNFTLTLLKATELFFKDAEQFKISGVS